jgi:regulator of protease activity HflC (stomatin/prohibitin superfamily)
MPTPGLLLIAAALFGALAVMTILRMTLFTVEQRSMALVQRLGKFTREAGPGLHAMIPFIDSVAGRMNLRVQQLDVKIETKTEDNVFVEMVVAVQYFVLPTKVYDAFYKLDNATGQITSFVFDVVRARVPKIKLDDLFEKKDEIADSVKVELAQVMEDFGYGILKALVTDIDPDPKVKESMNEINAAQRMRVAATERGEADRILRVKAAEGDAQSKALQGRGIADQRQAIIAGLRDSVDEFQKSVPGTTARDFVAYQRDPDPTLARQSHDPDGADAHCDDRGRPDRPGLCEQRRVAAQACGRKLSSPQRQGRRTAQRNR